jgi:hypothetical protein
VAPGLSDEARKAVNAAFEQSSRSWTRRPTSEVTVYAVASIWIDEPKSTKEKMMTARAVEILPVKTCPDKAGQPGNGKIHAQVFRHTVIKGIYDDNNE